MDRAYKFERATPKLTILPKLHASLSSYRIQNCKSVQSQVPTGYTSMQRGSSSTQPLSHSNIYETQYIIHYLVESTSDLQYTTQHIQNRSTRLQRSINFTQASNDSSLQAHSPLSLHCNGISVSSFTLSTHQQWYQCVQLHAVNGISLQHITTVFRKLGFMNQYYSNAASSLQHRYYAVWYQSHSNAALTLPNQHAASTSFTGGEISTQSSSCRKEITDTTDRYYTMQDFLKRSGRRTHSCMRKISSSDYNQNFCVILRELCSFGHW